MSSIRTLQRTAFLEDSLDRAIAGLGVWARIKDVLGPSSYLILEVGDGDLNPSGEVLRDTTVVGDFSWTGFDHVVTIETVERGLKLLSSAAWGADLRATERPSSQSWSAVSQAVIAHATDGEDGSVDGPRLDSVLQYGLFGEVRY